MTRFPYLILTIALFVFACSSSDDGGDLEPMGGGDDDDPVIMAPNAATLVFPEDDTECNEGVVNPNDNTKSTVTFEWNAATNADSYTVSLRNLNTNTTINSNSSTNEAAIIIDRGTPYEWFVISRAQGTTETANSPTWRFYNEGPGIENYAPFPAEAVNPQRGQNFAASTTVVFLQWDASDIDGDIVGYEVFLDTNDDPTTSLGTTTENTLADITVSSGTVYYWKVSTTDSQANTSMSEVFSFRVN
ncbi:MAG: hypothetical protein AAGB24_16170 [Bacteroidota bacterium]